MEHVCSTAALGWPTLIKITRETRRKGGSVRGQYEVFAWRDVQCEMRAGRVDRREIMALFVLQVAEQCTTRINTFNQTLNRHLACAHKTRRPSRKQVNDR